MEVSYTHEIPMGHRLKDHEGRCRFLHGHNYLVRVFVSGDLNDQGMVIDFHALKNAVRKVLEPYDHAFVLQVGDSCLREVSNDHVNLIYFEFPPTAENLATQWRNEIAELLGRRVKSVHVIVKETRDCEALT